MEGPALAARRDWGPVSCPLARSWRLVNALRLARRPRRELGIDFAAMEGVSKGQENEHINNED